MALLERTDTFTAIREKIEAGERLDFEDGVTLMGPAGAGVWVVTGSEGPGGTGSVGVGIGSSTGTSLGISGVGGWLAIRMSPSPAQRGAARSCPHETGALPPCWAKWRSGWRVDGPSAYG